MTKDDLAKLRELARKYAATLDAVENDEWWTTHAQLASHELERFLEWIEEQPADVTHGTFDLNRHTCQHEWEGRKDTDGLFLFCPKCTLTIPIEQHA